MTTQTLPFADAAAQGMCPERLAHASALLAAEVATQQGACRLDPGGAPRAGGVACRPWRGARCGVPAGLDLQAGQCGGADAAGRAGRVSLDDPVVHRTCRSSTVRTGPTVRVRDLLTHTSGLPDMLPDNLDLRRAHAPLSAFVQGACRTPLLYPPRTGFAYQSMGTLLAGEIVQRVSGQPLRDLPPARDLRGAGHAPLLAGAGRAPDCRHRLVPVRQQPGRGTFRRQHALLARHGASLGRHALTVTDLSLLLQTFLNGGQLRGQTLLGRSTVQRMVSDQNTTIGKPWGLGWGLATSPVLGLLRRAGVAAHLWPFGRDRHRGLGRPGHRAAVRDPDLPAHRARRRPPAAGGLQRGGGIGAALMDPLALDRRAGAAGAACTRGRRARGPSVTWRRFGSGPHLVLLHGGHGSWLHWVRNIEFLARHLHALGAGPAGLRRVGGGAAGG
jgi:CubicO group peptidase (beta-lactamase class C family)